MVYSAVLIFRIGCLGLIFSEDGRFERCFVDKLLFFFLFYGDLVAFEFNLLRIYPLIRSFVLINLRHAESSVDISRKARRWLKLWAHQLIEKFR
jgi:hypothetical protein